MADEYDQIPPETVANVTHYTPRRRSGSEQIPGLSGKTLLDYWSWAYSDIMENVQRAVYAEFLIATALGIDDGVRVGWRSYDLRYQDKKIEVKSSAYIQSWHTPKPSAIIFGVAKRLEMDDESAAYGSTPARYADVWVFSLFLPKEHSARDILDPRLWRFYVVRNDALERRVGDAKRASLATIEKLVSPVDYDKVKETIDRVLLT